MNPDATVRATAVRRDLYTAVANRAIWIVTAILSASLLGSILRIPIGWAPAAVVAGLAGLTVARPFDGLLVLCGIAPLAAVVLVLASSSDIEVRFPEALILAYITGWTARRALVWRPLVVSPVLRWAVIVLLSAALASAAVQASVMLAQQPAISIASFLSDIQRDYLVHINPITAALLFAEGLFLLLMVADACAGDIGRREAVVRMMVVGAAAAALLNVVRVVEVAVGRYSGWRDWLHLLTALRVNTQYGDLNAAGSYFSMMLFFAVGLFRRARVIAAISVPLLLAGLWITGSRTALAAVFLIAVAAVIAHYSRTRAGWLRISASLIALVVLAISIAIFYPRGRNAAAQYAVDVRVVLAKAAIRMTAAHPVFGVGLGRFYSLSQHYMNPSEDPGYSENAHNNFLQVLAELGIPGLLLFLGIIALAFREIRRTDRGRPQNWGLIAGLAAFLLTCVGGHPLLVPEVSYPFWIAIGLASAPASIPSRSTRAATAGAVLVIAFGAALFFRIPAAIAQADLQSASIGLSQWQHGADGAHYRWASGHSTFFVLSSARVVWIPLRRGSVGPDPIDVKIFVDGQEANDVSLARGDGWRIVMLQLRPAAHAVYERIDLQAVERGTQRPIDIASTDSGGVVMVGKPTAFK